LISLLVSVVPVCGYLLFLGYGKLEQKLFLIRKFAGMYFFPLFLLFRCYEFIRMRNDFDEKLILLGRRNVKLFADMAFHRCLSDIKFNIILD